MWAENLQTYVLETAFSILTNKLCFNNQLEC